MTKKFVCKLCGYDTDVKAHLISHLENITPCQNSEEFSREDLINELKHIERKNESITCKDCGKVISKSNYGRHRKTCKSGNDVEKDKEFDEVSMLRNQVYKLIEENNNLRASLNRNTQPLQLVITINNNDPKEPITKKKIPSRLRVVVWNKYIGENIGKSLCMCCKDNYISCFKFHCGHVIAESNGGETTLENLRPICDDCNQSMQSMNMKEFAFKYFKNDIL